MSQSSPVKMPFSSHARVNVPSIGWRLGWKLIDSCRLNLIFTGRWTRIVASTARCCTETSSLPPKPPPTSLFSTTILAMSSPVQPSMWAISCWVS